MRHLPWLAVLAACGGTSAARETSEVPAAPKWAPVSTSAETWSVAGDSPVRLRESPAGPAFAFLRPGAPFKVVSSEATQEGWLRVQTEGAIQARGVLDANAATGLRLRRAGRLGDGPFWLRVGDMLVVDASEALRRPGESIRGTVEVPLHHAHSGRRVGVTSGQVAVARSRLGHPSEPQGEPGEGCVAIPWRSLTLRSKPTLDAAQVFDPAESTFQVGDPALEVQARLLGRRGPWSAVLVGSGPYLSGFIHSEVPLAPCSQPSCPQSPCSQSPEPAEGSPETVTADSTLPEVLSLDSGRPLFKLEAGALLFRSGAPVARVGDTVWARRVALVGGLADVYVAADDAVSVRALVDIASLHHTSFGR